MIKGYVAIIGLGVTGLSCIQYYAKQGVAIKVFDQNVVASSSMANLQQQYPQLEFCGAQYDLQVLLGAEEVVVSPGVDLRQAAFEGLRQAGRPAVGDIELFAREVRAPVIAITGSNGKTTVCTLLHRVLTAAGLRVELGGNIGVPVLDLLSASTPDLYILELSSFQLESLSSLRDHIALVINVSQDHLDRYDSYDDYIQAKKHLYHNCRLAIVNADQPELQPVTAPATISFSLQSDNANYCLLERDGTVVIIKGGKVFCDISDSQLAGAHHWQNALVVMIIADCLKVDIALATAEICKFSGIEHRCQLVGQHQGVYWYNDSKATNEGAAVAAITTLAREWVANLILIAGGDAKNADFKQLKWVVDQHVSHVILLGKDRDVLRALLADVVPVVMVDTLQQAVMEADRIAVKGDLVLLAPACSSLDMFDSYAQRGELFKQCVDRLAL